ncbi:MAG: UTP--glucose-1-phosphate uridylyltransferase [Dermatophilus congolensis]|nr:UTP--glucose-1-phosphate uridylyltransferase [Dermatophilus congolensis]
MSEQGLAKAQEKMRAAGVEPTAITVFSHYYWQLEEGATGLILEADIDPVVDVPHLDDVRVSDAEAAEALGKTVMIRLNGGLGTSMGMDRAKSLLPVRDGKSFLQIIIEQVRHVRAATGARLPLILMNSFRTREDCLRVLEAYPDLAVGDLPLDFVQNQEPKLLADTLEPAEWPADPSLEWCPPGHGDIYTSLLGTGLLERLLEQGFRYAFSANGDNLGATADGRVAAWFAASGAPYAAEVSPRTPADRKGGHLAVRKSDGQMILRETAQTRPDELVHFTDETRHPYAHTNNLWFDLEVLHRTLVERDGVLGLPLMRNEKTVDPADPSSPRVYQLETALGAAVEAFPGATALVVGRDRFLPVKTTNDLLVMRSDAYEMGDDAIPRLRGGVSAAPLVDLDARFYKRIGDFDARFPAGPPSLAAASEFAVHGDWTFGADVVVRGDVFLSDTGRPEVVADGAELA